MDPYIVQHWLVWAIVAALLMFGAWMRMGSYLFYLGVAALIALAEALLRLRLRWQLGSFIAASVVPWLLGRAVARPRGKNAQECVKEETER